MRHTCCSEFGDSARALQRPYAVIVRRSQRREPHDAAKHASEKVPALTTTARPASLSQLRAKYIRPRLYQALETRQSQPSPQNGPASALRGWQSLPVVCGQVFAAWPDGRRPQCDNLHFSLHKKRLALEISQPSAAWSVFLVAAMVQFANLRQHPEAWTSAASVERRAARCLDKAGAEGSTRPRALSSDGLQVRLATTFPTLKSAASES